MSKIKEKAPVGKQMKEKIQAAPKELLRRGLSDGTQRLRGQLRDTAQRGQRDGYGGDQVEDAAWAGGHRAKHGIQKLLKQKKNSRAKESDHNSPTSPKSPAEPPSWDSPAPPDLPERPAPHGSTDCVRIKTREAVTRSSTAGDSKESLIKSAFKEAQKSSGSKIKTRDSMLQPHSDAVTPTVEPPAPFELPAIEKRIERVQIKTKEAVLPSSSEVRPQVENRQIKQRSGFFRSRPAAPEQAADTPRTIDPIAPKEHPRRVQIKTRGCQGSSPSVEQPSQVPYQRRELPQKKQTQNLAENRLGGQQPVQKEKTSNFAIPKTKDNTKSKPVSSRKMAVKTVHPDEIAHTSAKIAGRPIDQSVKKAERTSTQIIKSRAHGIRIVEQTTQAIPQARRRAMQAVRATKKTATVTTRSTVKAGTAALRATVRVARTLTAALAAGSSVVIAVVLIICMVGLITASPFGIFFSDSNGPDVASPTAAVAQINQEYADALSRLQAGGSYDSVKIIGAPPSWSDMLAVFSVKTTTEDGSGVAVLDEDNLERLRTVFWDMTKITTEEETVDHPASGNTPAWSETVLTITVTPRTPDDMRVFYSFTDTQNQMLDGLLANGGMLVTLAGDLSITSQDARELLAALPNGLSEERRAVVETACRLVGKVHYFWGGKSRVLGWDERWGQMKKVTASGSSTSGTYRPFGLDCSGFVDWVFYNVTGGSYIIGHGGGAHSQHTYCTAITWDQAIPGDLVFYPGDSHVGIVGGMDGNGNLLIIHCASSANNVVITGKSGFTSIARPNYYSK